MSMVSHLYAEKYGDMHCWCPACGADCEVWDEDECDILEDGNKEYFLHCPECDQGFYASESYQNETFFKRWL